MSAQFKYKSNKLGGTQQKFNIKIGFELEQASKPIAIQSANDIEAGTKSAIHNHANHILIDWYETLECTCLI